MDQVSEAGLVKRKGLNEPSQASLTAPELFGVEERPALVFTTECDLNNALGAGLVNNVKTDLCFLPELL